LARDLLGFLARRPSRAGTPLALTGHLLIIAKVEDQDIRAPILGMSRVVAISRRIPVLVKAATDLHDLQRAGPPAPLLDLLNCLGEPIDQ
jgi:hypothetical protein